MTPTDMLKVAAKVKERPILMHARSIHGILEGRKTMTRRIVKGPRSLVNKYPICRPDMMADPWAIWWHGAETDRVGVSQYSPYGQPGDRLWVRETFGVFAVDGCSAGIGYRADHPENGDLSKTEGGYNFRYLESIGEVEAAEKLVNAERWRPSIHMPRWASRLTLEITDIRVERIQSISEEDCVAEGCARAEMPNSAPRGQFRQLWDETNGNGAWDRNDWCWVVEFKKP